MRNVAQLSCACVWGWVVVGCDEGRLVAFFGWFTKILHVLFIIGIEAVVGVHRTKFVAGR